MDRAKQIFGNRISESDYKKACKQKKKYVKKFGDDSDKDYHLSLEDNKSLSDMGVKNIIMSKDGQDIHVENGLVVGNIRMGFGHYRISMAIASAAKAMGFKPLWFDLHSFSETTGGQVIKHLNGLYSMGSRWSQKNGLFNKLYWEPLNSEGFRKLSYNAMDQKMTELMVPILKYLPKDMPYVATHVWPAQAAVHSGVKTVVNVMPDNWPMALHLADGSIHTVQTPSSFMGYKALRGMDKKNVLKPMPDDSLYHVGHYIDHELVEALEEDTTSRLNRLNNQEPLRFLLTVGGAGAQKSIFEAIINHLLPMVKKGKAVLYINVGDHLKVWENLVEAIPALKEAVCHFNAWEETQQFAERALNENVRGIHAFYHEDIFEAVYSSNILMRSTDCLITKPSELSFYPLPKLMIKRVGGHEAYGAIRAAEVGDGTYECETIKEMLHMIDLLLSSNQLLTAMNEQILKAHNQEVYHGAYKAVALATGKSYR